jgi:hypothetical protein
MRPAAASLRNANGTTQANTDNHDVFDDLVSPLPSPDKGPSNSRLRKRNRLPIHIALAVSVV